MTSTAPTHLSILPPDVPSSGAVGLNGKTPAVAAMDKDDLIDASLARIKPLRERLGSTHETGVPAHADMPVQDPPPQLDRMLILSLATGGATDGEKSVREYHRHLHEEGRGTERGVLLAMRGALGARIDARAARARQLRFEIANCRRFEDDPSQEGRKPWTPMAVFGVIAPVAASAALLFIDAHSCAATLQESGLAIFVTEPWRAWVMASAPFILSAVSKVMLSLIGDARVRTAITLLLCVVSMAASLYWGYLFSMSFPGLAQPVSQILGDPFNPSAVTSDTPANSANLLVMMQILAGGFGSAVLFQMAQKIYDAHATGRRFETTEFTALRRALDALDTEAQVESEQLGRVEGRLTEIEAEGKSFCDRAAALYAALRTQVQTSDARVRPA